jgi:ammonium transporter, Amt family
MKIFPFFLLISKMDYTTSDSTLLLLIGGTLVFVMHFPGVALFYGGLVKRNSTVTIMMQTLICLGVVALIWFICGFSLVFGGNYSGIIGDLRYAFLKNYDSPGTTEASSIYLSSGAPTGSLLAFAFFQLQFAAITPSLMTGSFTDRMHFPSWLLFLVLYQFLIYIPVAHWNWGGGFLSKFPVLDFAGGLVVHSTAGIAAFTCVFPSRDPSSPITWSNFWMIPLKNGGMFKRRNTPIRDESYTPHNIPSMVIGTGMLWFGWFGFNGASALTVGANTALAWSNTHFAACMASLCWVFLHWLHTGKWSCVACATGCIAGLVAITPAAGFVPTYGAVLIGFITVPVCFYACKARVYFGLDDALDVSGVHGVGGLMGTILTGIFADENENGIGAPGALNGCWKQVGYQIAGALIVLVYVFLVVTFILIIIDNIPFIGPVRATEQEELDCDRVVTGESAYILSSHELRMLLEAMRVDSSPIPNSSSSSSLTIN